MSEVENQEVSAIGIGLSLCRFISLSRLASLTLHSLEGGLAGTHGFRQRPVWLVLHRGHRPLGELLQVVVVDTLAVEALVACETPPRGGSPGSFM